MKKKTRLEERKAIFHGLVYWLSHSIKSPTFQFQAFTDFNIGHASIYLSGLFDGDQELGRAMNEFLNENWKNVAAEMKPILEETICELFRKYANVIFHKYPLEQLFPE